MADLSKILGKTVVNVEIDPSSDEDRPDSLKKMVILFSDGTSLEVEVDWESVMDDWVPFTAIVQEN